MSELHRLVTRSDFDGLVCAVLLQEAGVVSEDIVFVHPKDVQDGTTPITDRDILTNLPYRPEAFKVFDHHASEVERTSGQASNHVIDPAAPSAARVVYNYFGGAEKFPNISNEIMVAVDKADSAQYNLEEILTPSDWFLLNTVMDARTGLGRFRTFRISNYELMLQLIAHCRNHSSVDTILDLPDVRERTDLFFSQQEDAKSQIKRCATVHDKLVILDLRREDPIWSASRFLIYAMFPECNMSVHILKGREGKNTVFAVGKSIVNRSSQAHIGSVMLSYGGGGHKAAGTCQVDNDKAEKVSQELIACFSRT